MTETIKVHGWRIYHGRGRRHLGGPVEEVVEVVPVATEDGTTCVLCERGICIQVESLTEGGLPMFSHRPSGDQEVVSERVPGSPPPINPDHEIVWVPGPPPRP